MTPRHQIGAVIIGRNEGTRLLACLQSVVAELGGAVVYVDSGSQDDSIANARSAGVEVVPLDMARPFTAARARNAGVAALCRRFPALQFVQFIDGDCVLQPGWIARAAEFLVQRPDIAVACGRRRERYPHASVYNRLCDWEWDTPPGAASACGGDALIRVDAFLSIGGFNARLIAGEEPELCVRLRGAGWGIWRLDAEMTLHDARMMRASQWWRRTLRGGHAWAEGMAMHGGGAARHDVRGSLRALLWGAVLPAAVLLLAVAAGPWALALLLAYPANLLRMALGFGGRTRAAWLRALFLMLAKFPEAVGVLGYWARRVADRPAHLIEYK